MAFLKRLLGGSDEDRRAGEDRGAGDDGPATPDRGAGSAASGGQGPAEDEARARDLVRTFDAGLDDLARRQLRFADLSWEPPSQLRRDGDWILMERWEARRDDGRTVTLKAGERLTWIGAGETWPGATRFRTAKGALVDLPPGRAEDRWPEDLQRPRSPTAGSEEG